MRSFWQQFACSQGDHALAAFYHCACGVFKFYSKVATIKAVYGRAGPQQSLVSTEALLLQVEEFFSLLVGRIFSLVVVVLFGGGAPALFRVRPSPLVLLVQLGQKPLDQLVLRSSPKSYGKACFSSSKKRTLQLKLLFLLIAGEQMLHKFRHELLSFLGTGPWTWR